MGVVRNRLLIQHTVKQFVKKKPKPFMQLVLEVGVYQIGWMRDSGMPDHALVHPLIELVKQKDARSAKFCNAILREVLRKGLQIPEGNSAKKLSIRYSHPEWLVKKWLKENGQHTLIKRLEVQNKKPHHWARLNRSKISDVKELPENITNKLGQSVFDWYYQIENGVGELLKSSEFSEGLFSIQDPASYLMYQLLAPEKSDLLFDACAAPGGKTALFLEQMKSEITVIAGDLKPHRLSKMSDLKTRLKLGSFYPVACDAQSLPFKQQFDKILIDAPCSNLGVLSRRPEAKWSVTQEDIDAIAELQRSILESCCAHCKPNGVMVYATCSPESEETVQIIEAFLKSHTEFVLESAEDFVDPRFVKNGAIQIIPGESDLDGFYGVRLRKNNQ